MRLPVLIASAMLLAACTSSSTSGKATATPTEIDPCAGATPAAGCTPPSASATVTYPPSAGSIPAFPPVPAFDGELGRASNDANPALRTATFTITVPKGEVIATDLICQGRGNVSIKTQPDSQGDQTINCDSAAIPSQLGVFASDPVTVTTTFTITVTADGPSRWLAAASARPAQ